MPRLNSDNVWDWKATAALPIGLGGSVFGWIVDPRDTDAILDRFFELGGRFIDTSDGYSYARRESKQDSESLIGSWVKRRGLEHQMRIITKVGLCPGVSGLAPAVVARAADASLGRLEIPSAEAILAHSDDKVSTPEDIAHGLAQLVGTRTRHIGVSGFSDERLAETLSALKCASGPRLTIMQEEFSLVERSGLDRVSATPAGTDRLGLVCSAALARGYLTGKFRDPRGHVGSRQAFVAQRYGTPRHSALLDILDDVSRRYGVQPAAVAIRWLLQHSSVALPLVSVTNPAQLDAFAEAATTRLTEADWLSLDEAAETLSVT